MMYHWTLPCHKRLVNDQLMKLKCAGVQKDIAEQVVRLVKLLFLKFSSHSKAQVNENVQISLLIAISFSVL